MRVLAENIKREKAYKVIEAFYASLLSMNYPVSSYRPGVLVFVDIEDGFQKRTLRYDGITRRILMK